MDTDKEFMYFSVETLQLLYGCWMGVGAGGVVYWFRNQTVLHIVHLSADICNNDNCRICLIHICNAVEVWIFLWIYEFKLNININYSRQTV